MSELLTWTAGYEVFITEKCTNFDSGIYGAFVNVVAIASSKEHFRELAAAALENDGYRILEIEDLQQIDLNDSDWTSDELELITENLSPENPVSYGHFNTYPKDGLDA